MFIFVGYDAPSISEPENAVVSLNLFFSALFTASCLLFSRHEASRKIHKKNYCSQARAVSFAFIRLQLYFSGPLCK
jgi:hypothetical protein